MVLGKVKGNPPKYLSFYYCHMSCFAGHPLDKFDVINLTQENTYKKKKKKKKENFRLFYKIKLVLLRNNS